jgi:hypothetical protein
MPRLTTEQDANNLMSQKVYDDLIANYDSSLWAVLDGPTTGSTFDNVRVGVFTVDLDALTTICAATTGCTFDATNYQPYAFGFLFDQTTNWVSGTAS